MQLAKFMASPSGRILRIVAGLALVYMGFGVVQGSVGIALGVIGIAPVAAGVFDVCLFAPAFGKPFKGKDIRKA